MNILRKNKQLRKSHMARNDAGVTLMELMIAAGISAVSLVVIMQSLMTVARLNAQTRERELAAGYASSVLEVLRGMPFNDMLALNPNTGGGTESFSTTMQSSPLFEFEGLNYATIYIEAQLNGPTGGTVTYPFPIDTTILTDALPNPLEVMVTLWAYTDAGAPFKVTTSTMIADAP